MNILFKNRGLTLPNVIPWLGSVHCKFHRELYKNTGTPIWRQEREKKRERMEYNEDTHWNCHLDEYLIFCWLKYIELGIHIKQALETVVETWDGTKVKVVVGRGHREGAYFPLAASSFWLQLLEPVVGSQNGAMAIGKALGLILRVLQLAAEVCFNLSVCAPVWNNGKGRRGLEDHPRNEYTNGHSPIALGGGGRGTSSLLSVVWIKIVLKSLTWTCKTFERSALGIWPMIIHSHMWVIAWCCCWCIYFIWSFKKRNADARLHLRTWRPKELDGVIYQDSRRNWASM